ncbi:MAG: hypothetical protein COX57_08135 [Alphaproteobacteria bacterium CG_4_10_14_0_2_um_filter_63_37]|nr:MAG: hypothetical protein AUJ55_07800 [Proteobacteria bacterium CG1_02_64_396]PJA24427.1 MAG: hypothetical protein COX57_08135 [Alphaproteobacteria bacterium CG_4_10_14_0_2_um_filter_63_37]
MKRLRLPAAILAGTALMIALLIATRPTPPPPEGVDTRPEVGAVVVEPSTEILQRELQGVVRPRSAAVRVAEAAGRIVALPEIGSRIAAGQPLWRMDDTLARAQRESARGAVLQAEANLELEQAAVARDRLMLDQLQARFALQQADEQRQISLKEKGQSSDMVVEQARVKTLALKGELLNLENGVAGGASRIAIRQGALVQARAQLRQAEYQVGLLQPTLDFAVTIQAQRAEVGGFIPLGSPVVEIDDGQPWRVTVPLGVEGLSRVAPGSAVALTDPEVEGVARVESAARMADAQTHTGPVTITIDRSAPVVGGQVVRLRLPLGQITGLFVPDRAVQRQGLPDDEGGKPYLYLVDASGHIERRFITLGDRVGSMRLIAKGIQVGETVVVRGMDLVRPGVEVRVKGGD